MENGYYISQIVAAVAVSIGTFVALRQFILNSKDSKAGREREYELHEKEIYEMEKDRVQKAIDLSEYYKDNVIYYVNVLKYVYDNTGISEVIAKVTEDKICHFDRIELQENIHTEDISSLENAKRKNEFIKVLIEASATTGFWDECQDVIIKEVDGKDVKEVAIHAEGMHYRFSIMVQDILNNLEYFAMAFTHGTADESVIYQSIHSSYLKVVRLLYYDISVNNITGEAKLFTNVIKLYNIWHERAKKQKKDEIVATRENISLGNILK